MHAQQDRPGQPHRQPGCEQLEQRAHGDRAHPDRQHLIARQPVQRRPPRSVAARGGNQPYVALRPHPPQREPQRSGARRIHVGQVIQRDQHRTGLRLRRQHRPQRSADGPLVDSRTGVRLQHHHLQCAPLRRRQADQDRRCHGAQQIGQSHPRKLRLGDAGPGGQHQVASAGRPVQRPLPQGSLPDPGRPGQDRRHRLRAAARGNAKGNATAVATAVAGVVASAAGRRHAPCPGACVQERRKQDPLSVASHDHRLSRPPTRRPAHATPGHARPPCHPGIYGY